MKLTFDETQDLIKIWAGRCQKLRDRFDSDKGDKKIRTMLLLAAMVARVQNLIALSYEQVTDLTTKTKAELDEKRKEYNEHTI
jgi:hypothetical protein